MQSRARSARLALAVGLALLLAVPLAFSPASGAGSAVGSCSGFRNQTGITDTAIRLGNASDITGPVPNLYKSAQQAAKAYVASFNATRNICGRKLVLDTFDSKTDAAKDKAATQKICAKDFAAIGSLSAFDDGGATTAQQCALPDVRATSSSPARNACSSCFGVETFRSGEGPNAIADYFVDTEGAATQKAAMLYVNVGSAGGRAKTAVKVATKRGMKFVYSAAIDVADFNYGPYVTQMKSLGVRWVQIIGAPPQTARLASAMADAGFSPDTFLVGASSYDGGLTKLAGADAAGAIAVLTSLPLTSQQAELNTYRTWLKKIDPKAKPTVAGLYAWSAAKLTVAKMVGLGGKLTRAHLIAELRKVSAWTGGGMHAPMPVGTKHVSPCVRFLQVKNGAWVSLGGTAYHCSGVSKVT